MGKDQEQGISRKEPIVGQDLFERALESAPNAIIIVDTGGTIILANRQAEAMFGHPRSELLGRQVDMLVPDRFRLNHADFVRRFMSAPKARPMGAGRDLYGLRVDGTEFPIEIGLNPIRTREGLFTLASIIDITERKRAEERFRLVVEAAPNAMLMVGRDGSIVLVNAQAERLFGYSRQELLGQPVEMLVPERFRKDHPGHREAFFEQPRARAMGAGRDLFGKRKDGTEVPIEIGLNPIETPEGLFTLASIIDITERKRAGEALSRLAAIVESSDDAIVSKDLSGVIKSWNRGAQKLYGYSAEEAVGNSVSMLVPPDHQDDLDDLLERFRRGEHVQNYETVRQRKDGQRVIVSVTGSPILDAGVVVGASVTARDITERRKAEERVHLVVEAAPNAMVMVDHHGRVVLVNKRTEELFGYPREELLDQRIEMLVPERFRADHPDHVRGFFRKPEVRAMGSGRELFGRRKDGSEVPIEIGLNPIETPDGLFTLASIIDITERKRLQEAEILETRNEELETLLHVISHDLKEPLRAINNFSHILFEESGSRLDGTGRGYLQRVIQASVRMGRLLEDILALSRVRRIEPPAEDQDLGRLVEDALNRIEYQVVEREAKVHVAGPFPSWPVDPTWTTQAIYNLVSNALKFTGSDRPCEIEVSVLSDASPDATGIVVRDRGPGVPEELAERIFGLFQRAVGREIEGTGSGLAIVRAVAERHSGQAWVRPREGGGSEFVITFGRITRRKEPSYATADH